MLSKNQIGFADFSGNRQYITVGNLTTDPRIAMILMDYQNRERLKILDKVKLINSNEDPALIEILTPKNYDAKIAELELKLSQK